VGIHHAEQSAEIGGSPEACFEAITDYESFPAWQDAVQTAEVLERYPDGLGEVVRFEIDAKVKRISYTLRYRYDRPARIWWEFIAGEGVGHVEGEYLLEALGGGERTIATYRLGIDPGIPVPGLIARRLNQGVMRRSVSDLREEVERRALG
jgi:hypothetical protein